MNKHWLRKPMALIMVMVMLLSMTACGKQEDKKSDSTTNTPDTKEMVYQANDFELDGLQGDISGVFVQNDRLYIRTYEWIEGISTEETAGEESDTTEEATSEKGSETEDTAEEESSEEVSTEEASTEEDTTENEAVVEEESTSDSDAEEETATDEVDAEALDEGIVDATSTERLYSMNMDGSDLQEHPVPELDEDQWLQSIMVGQDGTMMFLLNSYNEKTEENTYILLKTDAQGKELLKEDITKLLNLTQYSYMSGVVLDEKGRVVVALEQSVYVIAEDLKSTQEIKSDAYIEGISMTKDGKIICGMVIWEEESGGAQVREVDVDNKKWGETYDLDLQYFSSSNCLMNGVDYDFYYKDDSGIYGYSIADKQATKLLDYVASDITSNNSGEITPIAKDTFLGMVYDEIGSKVVKYTKVDASTIEDKTVITFGAMWVDDAIKKQAIEFNKSSKEYRIEFVDYSNEEDPVTKMNADIVAGNIPDILSLNLLPYEQYIAKGMLEDLTPYYENDEEIGTEDLIDSVYEAMQIDGKLYYVAPSFGLSTIVARTKDVGTGTGWTFEEMKALLEEKGDSARPFYSENKSEMLYSFLGNGLNDFVDWQTGECSFDSQDFKDILEICNKGTNEETDYSEDSPSMPSLVKEGKILFVEGWISPEEVQVYKKMFDEDITYIGYPNKEKQGSYFQFDSQVAIYAKSEVKEGAWEFIRTLMMKEYQGNNLYMYNTPTRQDCFDMMVKAMMATKEYTDELGQEIYPISGSWGWDDLEVETTPLSQEEMDMYINLVNNTNKTATNDDAMMEIVQEEAKAYFAGEKSLDETVEIIQNRVKTYVNENR